MARFNRRRLTCCTNPLGTLPNQLQLHHLPLKNIMDAVLQAHVWTAECRDHRSNKSLQRDHREYNALITNKAEFTASLHDRATELAVRTDYLYGHGILEISYDVGMVTKLAATSKSNWRNCHRLLQNEALTTKIWADIREHSRKVGRHVLWDDPRTAVDLRHFLHNKRMATWLQHHLPLHQFLKMQVKRILQA